MLFRKSIEPACTYCSRGRKGEDDSIICIRRGIVNPWDSCRSFRYDPLLRIPEAEPLPVMDVDPEDFRL